MTNDKQKMQADGGGVNKGGNPSSGREGGGDSGGGAYSDPRPPKKQTGFFGHGGQSEVDQKLTPGEPD